jgi:hypothetical protein
MGMARAAIACQQPLARLLAERILEGEEELAASVPDLEG